MREASIAALVACAALLAAASARADAIGPPPASCPDGSNPSSSHAGAYCAAPYACSSGCSPGDECRTVHVCISPRQGYSLGGPFTVDEVTASCEPGSTCADGAPCQTRTGCVARAPDPWAQVMPDDEGDAASVAVGAGAALCGCVGAPLLAVVVIAIARARSNQKR